MIHKKKLAGKILRVSYQKVRFAEGAQEDVQKAITRSDMRGLIAVGKVYVNPQNYHSRAGARKNAAQKRKGRQQGRGSKKGSKHSIVTRKDFWMTRVRLQRKFVSELREKGLLTVESYRLLRNKMKGGYFRNLRHLKLYLTEHHLVIPTVKKSTGTTSTKLTK